MRIYKRAMRPIMWVNQKVTALSCECRSGYAAALVSIFLQNDPVLHTTCPSLSLKLPLRLYLQVSSSFLNIEIYWYRKPEGLSCEN